MKCFVVCPRCGNALLRSEREKKWNACADCLEREADALRTDDTVDEWRD